MRGFVGWGTVFRLNPAAPGMDWSETVLASFSVFDGATPAGSLIGGPPGALYGTAQSGGSSPCSLLRTASRGYIMAAMLQPRPALCLWVVTWAAAIPALRGQNLQSPNGRQFNVRITGKLLDFHDAPIAGAAIGLAPWDKGVWQPVTQTSAAGDFDLNVRLDPGAYQVIAAFGQLKVATAQVELRRPSTTAIEVTLRASEETAQSDQPPDLVPPAGLLPQGSFPAAPPRLSGRLPSRRIPSPAQAESGSGAPSPPPPPPPTRGLEILTTQEFVNVFYVTNRTPASGVPGSYIDGPVVQTNASYGVCKVSIPAVHKPGVMERPSIFRLERTEDPNRHIVIVARDVSRDQEAFENRLHQAFAESGSEAFLFIHGYNVSFDDAVRRTAQLFRDLQFDGVPILFSWPGQNAWWRYMAAEDAVDVSARQLEEFLRATFANKRLNAVNIVAHSMGNRVLMTALDRLSHRRDDLQFNNIVMAAPDINIADFQELSGRLKAFAQHRTIYSSSRDMALFVSKQFHSYPRLGEAPPLSLAEGIDTVDASNIHQDLLGHSYFGDSLTVLHDLFLLLKEGESPDQRALQPATLNNARYWIVPN